MFRVSGRVLRLAQSRLLLRSRSCILTIIWAWESTIAESLKKPPNFLAKVPVLDRSSPESFFELGVNDSVLEAILVQLFFAVVEPRAPYDLGADLGRL